MKLFKKYKLDTYGIMPHLYDEIIADYHRDAADVYLSHIKSKDSTAEICKCAEHIADFTITDPDGHPMHYIVEGVL